MQRIGGQKEDYVITKMLAGINKFYVSRCNTNIASRTLISLLSKGIVKEVKTDY